jgi:hypothetical protein
MTTLTPPDLIKLGPPSADKLKRMAVQSKREALLVPFLAGGICLVTLALAGVQVIPLPYLSFDVPLVFAALFVGAREFDEHVRQFREVGGAEDLRRLYQFCESTPEGKAYRAAVVREGRPMRYIEMEALQRWANTAPERSAYRQLYGMDAEARR